MELLNRNSAALWLVLASFVWALAGVSWKYFSTLGYAFITVFLVSRIFKFLTVGAISYYRFRVHEPIKNAKEFSVIFLNALFSVGTPLCFFMALGYTTVSNAYFLQYTMPAWVLVAAVLLLGEKLTSKKLAGFVLTIGGIALIASPSAGLEINAGFLLGILAAFSQTGDIITARALKDYSYHTISFYSNFLQLVMVAIILPLLFPVTAAGFEAIPLLAFAAIGVLLGIASDLYYHVLDTLEASTAAIISFSELFFAGALAFIIFGERPLGNELIGYALILSAGVIIVLRRADIWRFEHLLRFTDRM